VLPSAVECERSVRVVSTRVSQSSLMLVCNAVGGALPLMCLLLAGVARAARSSTWSTRRAARSA
jgi:hypothetical protein